MLRSEIGAHQSGSCLIEVRFNCSVLSHRFNVFLPRMQACPPAICERKSCLSSSGRYHGKHRFLPPKLFLTTPTAVRALPRGGIFWRRRTPRHPISDGVPFQQSLRGRQLDGNPTPVEVPRFSRAVRRVSRTTRGQSTEQKTPLDIRASGCSLPVNTTMLMKSMLRWTRNISVGSFSTGARPATSLAMSAVPPKAEVKIVICHDGP